MAGHIARHIAEAFELRSVGLYDQRADTVTWAGPQELPALDDEAPGGGPDRGVAGTTRRGRSSRRFSSAARRSAASPCPTRHSATRCCSRWPASPRSASNALAAVEATARAEAARESSELRATVLDALAHEFKTPLTSMKAAVERPAREPRRRARRTASSPPSSTRTSIGSRRSSPMPCRCCGSTPATSSSTRNDIRWPTIVASIVQRLEPATRRPRGRAARPGGRRRRGRPGAAGPGAAATARQRAEVLAADFDDRDRRDRERVSRHRRCATPGPPIPEPSRPACSSASTEGRRRAAFLARAWGSPSCARSPTPTAARVSVSSSPDDGARRSRCRCLGRAGRRERRPDPRRRRRSADPPRHARDADGAGLRGRRREGR